MFSHQGVQGPYNYIILYIYLDYYDLLQLALYIYNHHNHQPDQDQYRTMQQSEYAIGIRVYIRTASSIHLQVSL